MNPLLTDRCSELSIKIAPKTRERVATRQHHVKLKSSCSSRSKSCKQRDTLKQSAWRGTRYKVRQEDSLWEWREYNRRLVPSTRWDHSPTTHFNFGAKMPISGSTRTMLRARRKDINLKPNRRLDRKSSRGMLFENEELRMRTITINAEVEQGQQALKKLRRENEQLRREVWSLRDEYHKMEKLLKDKENDGNESDQENSYSDECSLSEGSVEEDDDGAIEEIVEANETLEGLEEKKENIDSDNMQISNRLCLRRNSRQLFDGLSVIDEQTEETTQTTERSRASSVNHGLCAQGDPYYDSLLVPPPTKSPHRIRLQNGLDADILYERRPPSPYPYTKTMQEPSYQQRLEALEDSMFKLNIPAVSAPANGWVYPVSNSMPSQFYSADSYQIQNRLGPDVYITDGQLNPFEENELLIADQQQQMKKIEISQRQSAENSPKATMDSVGRENVAETALNQSETCKERFRTADSAASCPVSCQNADCEHHVRQEDNDNCEMPRDKQNLAKQQPYQSKLSVTLKFPESRQSQEKKLPKVHPKTNYPIVKEEKSPQSYPIVVSHKSDENLSRKDARTVPKLQTFFSTSQRTAAIRSKFQPSLPNLHTNFAVEALRLPIPVSVPVVPDIPTDSSQHCKDAGFYSDEGKTTTKIPPQPPPRTSSCPNSLNIQIPMPPIGVTAQHFRSFRQAKTSSQFNLEKEDSSRKENEVTSSNTNPFLTNEPIATSSPTLRNKFGPRKSEDRSTSRLRKQSASCDETTTDDGLYMIGATGRRLPRGLRNYDLDYLNARKWRKQSQASVYSVDTAEQNPDRKISKSNLNNMSISSSSGLDSPTKSTRPKRRVSIKFNRHKSSGGDAEEERPGILTNHRSNKLRNDDTETISERERTNSVSSRTSSLARRKLSSASSRTIFREEKIPWCGCWGNGCL